VDVLSDVLSRSRARGAAFSHTSLRGTTGMSFPAQPGLAVHALLDGCSVLQADGEPDRALLAGDLVLVRGDLAYDLAPAGSGRRVPLKDVIARGQVAGSSRRYVAGTIDAPESALVLCGAYLFHGALFQPLLDALPAVVHVRPAPGSTLRSTVDLLAREVLDDTLGQQTLLDRLLDVALVQLMREHFQAEPATAPRWFGASTDPTIAVALGAVHADPARPWTVGELADAASVSRAVFARRFTELVGAPPLQYVREWRMALAREQLHDTGNSLATIAANVGYTSEFAFAAAFKRQHGVAPGRWRRERPTHEVPDHNALPSSNGTVSS
jgi:AraC-like DNA-binding protein